MYKVVKIINYMVWLLLKLNKLFLKLLFIIKTTVKL